MKTTIKKRMDYNSTVNQKIKGKFVQREVLTCFSYEMDEILKTSMNNSNTELPTWEDIENLFYFDTEGVIYNIMEEYQYNKESMIEYANNPETYNRRVKNSNDFEVFLNSLDDDELKELCRKFSIDIDDEISKPQEIYEWWIVTEWLYNKLKRYGESVLEWGNNCYWGRTTTGQAIMLDYVISKICEDMKILKGQKYDWSNQ